MKVALVTGSGKRRVIGVALIVGRPVVAGVAADLEAGPENLGAELGGEDSIGLAA